MGPDRQGESCPRVEGHRPTTWNSHDSDCHWPHKCDSRAQAHATVQFGGIAQQMASSSQTSNRCPRVRYSIPPRCPAAAIITPFQFSLSEYAAAETVKPNLRLQDALPRLLFAHDLPPTTSSPINVLLPGWSHTTERSEYDPEPPPFDSRGRINDETGFES